MATLGMVGAVAASALLASCGGSGDTIEPFRPNRILAFGDELSVIETDGRKHSINAFKLITGTQTEDPTTLDCTRSPIWIQTVATGAGLAFDRCLGSATTASGQVLAQPGHKVADLPAQLAAVQGAPFNDNDLALMLVGMHDILEAYGRYPAESRESLLDELRARATVYGQRINTLAQSGPAVVVLTVPDIGLTPFAKAENAANAGRAALLSEFTAVFNNRMSVTLINDGRLIGLVFADIEIQNMAKIPRSFNLTNVLDVACLASSPLPDCRSNTLVTGATAAGWMWADTLRPGPTVQARMGTLANFRARNNPF